MVGAGTLDQTSPPAVRGPPRLDSPRLLVIAQQGRVDRSAVSHARSRCVIPQFCLRSSHACLGAWATLPNYFRLDCVPPYPLLLLLGHFALYCALIHFTGREHTRFAEDGLSSLRCCTSMGSSQGTGTVQSCLIALSRGNLHIVYILSRS